MTVVLDSLHALNNLMQDDAARPSRYAVRFILVHSVDDWKKLNGYFRENIEKSRRIYLSKAFTADDGQPRAVSILETLDACKDGPYLLSPLSEALRLYGAEAYEAIVKRLALLENGESTAHRRIYVPMLGMDAVLMDVISKLSGANVEGRLADVWSVETQYNEAQSLCVIPASIRDLSGPWTSVVSLKEYFRLWEQSCCTNVGIVTEHTDRICCITDSVFTVNVFHCAYDMLAQCHEEILDIPKAALDEASWIHVLHLIRKGPLKVGSLIDVASAALHLRHVSEQALFTKLLHSDWAEQCTVWIVMKLLAKRAFFSNYARLALDQSDAPGNIIASIERAILSCLDWPVDKRLTLHKERIELFKYVGIEELSDAFWAEWARFAPEKRLNGLSFFTKKERAAGIRLMFVELEYSLEDASKRADICALYPALAAYVSPFVTEEADAWLKDYFDEYRLCKLRDSLSDRLRLKMNEWIVSRKYYDYKPRNDRLVKDYAGKNVSIHFRDCIGAEWLPAISQLELKRDPSLEAICSSVRSTWPSITEENRPDDAYQTKHFDEKGMDKLIHDAIEYPMYLVDELEEIERIAACAAGAAIESRVVVTADHGSSRMAVLNKTETVEAPKGMAVRYFGRYIDGEWQDGPEWEVRRGCTIMKGYKRFSVSGMHGCEIHGGGTPEESLVPLILLQKAVMKIKYYDATIRIQPGGQLVWRAELSKEATGFSIGLPNGRTVSGTQSDGDGGLWVFNMGELQPGPAKLKPFVMTAENPDGIYLDELTINIVGGISERKLKI